MNMEISATPVAYWAYEKASPNYYSVFFEIRYDDPDEQRIAVADWFRILCEKLGVRPDNKDVLQLRPEVGPDFYLQNKDGNFRFCTEIQGYGCRELPPPNIIIDEDEAHLRAAHTAAVKALEKLRTLAVHRNKTSISAAAVAAAGILTRSPV